MLKRVRWRFVEICGNKSFLCQRLSTIGIQFLFVFIQYMFLCLFQPLLNNDQINKGGIHDALKQRRTGNAGR
jgi:hypothetical protein